MASRDSEGSNLLATVFLFGCGGLCICSIFFGIIAIIVTLTSIHTLGPEDQMVIEYLDGKGVVNGPCTKVLNPFRDKFERQATRLGPLEFMRLKNSLDGFKRVVEGPQLVFMGAYEEHEGIEEKISLKKDQYIRFVDRLTGTERVLQGPRTIVPGPWEDSANGVQQAHFVNRDQAVIVLNRADGTKRLETQSGVFFPQAYEVVTETRNLIRVLPHETVVVRTALGNFVIYSGAGVGNEAGTSFFLQPYDRLVKMYWSTFAETGNPEDPQTITKEVVERIDMRVQKVVYKYEVRTSDNVNLRIQGTIFWQMRDVGKMLNRTADPSGDVWQHARSALISAVSRVNLDTFMKQFNSLVANAFNEQAGDNFYVDRGVEVHSMEVTQYDCVDQETANTLQDIIEETTNRINRLQAQRSQNDVEFARLQADILLEQQKTQLIVTQSLNLRLQAEKAGEAKGAELAKAAVTFLEGLNTSLPDITQRVDLYKLHKQMENQNMKTQHLSRGTGKLFITPEDMNLNLNYQ